MEFSKPHYTPLREVKSGLPESIIEFFAAHAIVTLSHAASALTRLSDAPDETLENMGLTREDLDLSISIMIAETILARVTPDISDFGTGGPKASMLRPLASDTGAKDV
ncbi:MAG: hypothetical protein CSA72_02710 [Rhodobacterales bacterium]|nr:MAG: hypothetical protein CSA72_02710 [Rhodobacterales bacterium]